MQRSALLALLAAPLTACSTAGGPGGPTSVRVAPPWVALLDDDSTRLAATGPHGDTIPSGVSWTSSDTAIADVSPAGRVHARSLGTAVVTATYRGFTGTARIVVAPPVLVGAGDIAGCTITADSATAALLDTIPGVVFTAGDNAYVNGTLAEFTLCYDPTWGRHKHRTRPSPGNHDYNTPGAVFYYSYFGALAGDSGVGYYSYDFAGWHIVSLNSNVPMSAGSAQEQWLRADLALHPAPCSLAYWHHPRFNSGTTHGNFLPSGPVWEALYELGADVVISGHEHVYERFAPQRPDSTPDAAAGIREFVVGTGGAANYNFGTPKANSEVRNNTTHGVLALTLSPTGYAWKYITTTGAVADSGSASCH